MNKLKKTEFIIWFLLLLILVMCNACKNYEVVSEIDIHLYHLQNPRNKKVEVVLTKEKLVVGKFYRLKSIKQYDLENPSLE